MRGAYSQRCAKFLRISEQLNWPTSNPDLNPIEHVWDKLGKHAKRRRVRNIEQLREPLLKWWESIPQ